MQQLQSHYTKHVKTTETDLSVKSPHAQNSINTLMWDYFRSASTDPNDLCSYRASSCITSSSEAIKKATVPIEELNSFASVMRTMSMLGHAIFALHMTVRDKMDDKKQSLTELFGDDKGTSGKPPAGLYNLHTVIQVLRKLSPSQIITMTFRKKNSHKQTKIPLSFSFKYSPFLRYCTLPLSVKDTLSAISLETSSHWQWRLTWLSRQMYLR
jgi:hypothetical protein